MSKSAAEGRRGPIRTVYLLRHGKPDIPDGRRMCLGSTDLPLGPLGRLQAALAGAALRNAGLTAVYCSRLARSRQSAGYLGAPAIALPGLEELDAGQWDGLYYDEIMARWPAVYALRGADRAAPIPGAESWESGQKRFSSAMARAMAESSGAVAVVAHASVMQAFLCEPLGLPLSKAWSICLPYGSVTRLNWADGPPAVLDIGLLPHPALDADLCGRLLAAAGVPTAVSGHCAAVAAAALGIARALKAAGMGLSEDLIFAAAMLHDIARDQGNHAGVGARWMDALGYGEIADIIRQHHDPDDPGQIDEATVVFIADKLAAGTVRTTLSGRFAASREKCVSAAALSTHEKRYEQAAAVAGKINCICGKEIIP